MTREIRFRAYSKATHKMLTWEDVKTVYNWNILDTSLNTNIMQFTGLKDKNGLEIYEGDIVKKQRYRNTSETPRRKDGSYTITIGWYNDGVRNGFNLGSGKDIEVIGNIYENPDLVKELV